MPKLSDCLRTRNITAPCCVCGQRDEVCHVPLTEVAGVYCSACCPCCKPGKLGAKQGGACASMAEVVENTGPRTIL